MESKLLSLPIELFEPIYKQLPPPARASLALTCKGLFQICRSVFDEPWLFSRDALVSRPTFRSDYLRNRANDDLMEFLMLLESERWIYCASCFKLHAPSEFDEAQLHVSAREISCKWPGVVLFPRYVTFRRDFSICRERPTDHAIPWCYQHDIPEIADGCFAERTVELFRDSREDVNTLRATVFYWVTMTWPEIFGEYWIPVMLCPHVGLFDILCQEGCPYITTCTECSMEVRASFGAAGDYREYWVEATFNLEGLLHEESGNYLWLRQFQHGLRCRQPPSDLPECWPPDAVTISPPSSAERPEVEW